MSRLVADDLLVRAPDQADRRVGRLHLTEPAQRLADASRAARRAALAEVLDQLDDREIDTLTAGMEVLTKMTQLLAERAP